MDRERAEMVPGESCPRWGGWTLQKRVAAAPTGESDVFFVMPVAGRPGGEA